VLMFSLGFIMPSAFIDTIYTDIIHSQPFSFPLPLPIHPPPNPTLTFMYMWVYVYIYIFICVCVFVCICKFHIQEKARNTCLSEPGLIYCAAEAGERRLKNAGQDESRDQRRSA
jgi:hypothetical protein